MLKRCIVIAVSLLMAVLCAFAAKTYVTRQTTPPPSRKGDNPLRLKQDAHHQQMVAKRASPAVKSKKAVAARRALKSRKAVSGVRGIAVTRGAAPSTVLAPLSAGSRIDMGGGTWWHGEAADLNGDNKKDFVTIVQKYDQTTSIWKYYISVALSNGDGTFQTPQLTLLQNSPFGGSMTFQVADLNKDGKPDVVVFNSPSACCGGGTQVSASIDVYLGNGDGTFTYFNSYTATYPTSFSWWSDMYARATAITDLNGDGKLDLVVTYDWDTDSAGGQETFTLLGNGDGSFQASTYVDTAFDGAPMFADLNSDGIVDVIFTDGNNNYRPSVAMGQFSGGTLNFGTPTVLSGAEDGSGGVYIAVGDLNGEKKPDIVMSYPSYNAVMVFLNDHRLKAGGLYCD